MSFRPLLLALTLVAAAPTLGSCGFQPLYAPATVAGLSRIEVATISERTGYLLREQLDDQLGRDRDQPPLYRLQLTFREIRAPYGARVNNVATRYGLVLSAQFQLIDIGTGKVLHRSGTDAQVGYDSADPPYSGVTAQQSAEERVALLAASQIRLDLARYFTDLPTANSPGVIPVRRRPRDPTIAPGALP